MEGVCHLSTICVATYLYRPTPRLGRATLTCRYTWSFNPQDVRLTNVAIVTVSSYLAFSPLPKRLAVVFCYVTLTSRPTSRQEIWCSALPGLSSCCYSKRQTILLLFYKSNEKAFPKTKTPSLISGYYKKNTTQRLCLKINSSFLTIIVCLFHYRAN